jgi:hypothetical protein
MADTTLQPIDKWVKDLLDSVPDLQTIYDKVIDKKTGKALETAEAIAARIAASNWYMENGPIVAANIQMKYKFGQAYYDEKVQGAKDVISGLATKIGINASDPAIAEDLASFAETAMLHGWDAATVESRMLGNQKFTAAIQGGAYAKMVTDIGDYANLYGITLTDTQRKDYQGRLLGIASSKGIVARASADDIKAELRAKSANTYSIFKDQINAGQSLYDLTSAYREKMAGVLEIDPDAIKWNDPLWKDGKIFQAVDAKSGQISMRPLYEVDKMLRQDERWQYTKNANDTYSKYTSAILSKFGMVAI